MSDQPVDLNLEELKELIKLLRESDVSEFELRKADYRLRIRHGIVTNGSGSLSKAETSHADAQKGMEKPAELPEQPPVEIEKFHEIRSPMVGTFYRSSSPGAASFVEVGDMVRKNQVLCIVEAMKIMNEIESDVDGEIRKVHAANGQPVEYGEALFSIKPI